MARLQIALLGCLLCQGLSASPQPATASATMPANHTTAACTVPAVTAATAPLVVRVEDRHGGESLTVSEIGGRIEIVVGGSRTATPSKSPTVSLFSHPRPPGTASLPPIGPIPSAPPLRRRRSLAEVAEAAAEAASAAADDAAAAAATAGSAVPDDLVDATLRGLDAAAAELLSARLARAHRGAAGVPRHVETRSEAVAKGPLAASFVIDVPFPSPSANATNASAAAGAASEVVELVATVRLAPVSPSASVSPSPTTRPVDGSVIVRVSTTVPSSRIRQRRLRGGGGDGGEVLGPPQPAAVRVTADVREPRIEGAAAVGTATATAAAAAATVPSTPADSAPASPAPASPAVFLEQRESSKSGVGSGGGRTVTCAVAGACPHRWYAVTGVVETVTADVVGSSSLVDSPPASQTPAPAEASPEFEQGRRSETARFTSRDSGSENGLQSALLGSDDAGGLSHFPLASRASPSAAIAPDQRRFPVVVGSATPDAELEGLRASIALAVHRENERLRRYREAYSRLAPEKQDGYRVSRGGAAHTDLGVTREGVAANSDSALPGQKRINRRHLHEGTPTAATLADIAEETALGAFLSRLRNRLDRVSASYDVGRPMPASAQAVVVDVDLDDVCSTLQSCSSCSATSVCTWCASASDLPPVTGGGACVSSHSALEARTWLCPRPFRGTSAQCPVPAAVRELERQLRAEEQLSQGGSAVEPNSRHWHDVQKVDAARAEAVSRDIWLRRIRILARRDAAAARVAVRRALAVIGARHRSRRRLPAVLSPEPLRVIDAAAVTAAATTAALDRNASGLGELRVTYRAVVSEVERPARPNERGVGRSVRELRVLYLPVAVAPERFLGDAGDWWRSVGRLIPSLSPSPSPTASPSRTAATRSASAQQLAPSLSESPSPSVTPSPTSFPSETPSVTRTSSPSQSGTPAPTPPRAGDSSIEGLLSTADHASKAELADGGAGASTPPKFADDGVSATARPDESAVLLADRSLLPAADRFAAAAAGLSSASQAVGEAGAPAAGLEAAAADADAILSQASGAIEHPTYDFGPPRLIQVEERELLSGASLLRARLDEQGLAGSDVAAPARVSESTAQVLRDELAANAATLSSLDRVLAEPRPRVSRGSHHLHAESAPADLAFRAASDAGSSLGTGLAADAVAAEGSSSGQETEAESTSASTATAALASGLAGRVLSPETLGAVHAASSTASSDAPSTAAAPSISVVAIGTAPNTTAPNVADALPPLSNDTVAAAVTALAAASAQLSNAQSIAAECIAALKTSSARARTARASLSAAVGRVVDATLQLDADRAAIDLSLQVEQVPVLHSETKLPSPLPMPSAGASLASPTDPVDPARSLPHRSAHVPPVPRRLIELRHAQTTLLAGRIVALGNVGRSLRTAYATFNAARAAKLRDANATRVATASMFRAAELFARARLSAIEGYRSSMRSIVDNARAVSAQAATAATAATQARQIAEAKLFEDDSAYRSAERLVAADLVRSGRTDGSPAAVRSQLSREAAVVVASEALLREAVAKEDASNSRATDAAKAVVLALDAQEALRREQQRLEALVGEASSMAARASDSDDPAVLEADLDAARELALGARSNAPVGSAQSKASLASDIAALDALADSASGAQPVDDTSIARVLDTAREAIGKTHATATALSLRAGAYGSQEILYRVSSASRALERVISLPEQHRIAAVGVQMLSRNAASSIAPSASGPPVLLELHSSSARSTMVRRGAYDDERAEERGGSDTSRRSHRSLRVNRQPREREGESEAGDAAGVERADSEVESRRSPIKRARQSLRFAMARTRGSASSEVASQGQQAQGGSMDPRYQLGPFEMPAPSLGVPAVATQSPIATSPQTLLQGPLLHLGQSQPGDFSPPPPPPTRQDQQQPLRQPLLGDAVYSLPTPQSQPLQGELAYAASLILRQQAQIAALQQQVSELQQLIPAPPLPFMLDSQQIVQQQLRLLQMQQRQQVLEQQAAEEDYRRLFQQQALRQWQVQQQLLQPQLTTMHQQWFSPAGGGGVTSLLPRFTSASGAAGAFSDARLAALRRADLSSPDERSDVDRDGNDNELSEDAIESEDAEPSRPDGTGEGSLPLGQRAGGRRLLVLNSSEPDVVDPVADAAGPRSSPAPGPGDDVATSTAASSPWPSPVPVPAAPPNGPYVGPFSAATPLPEAVVAGAATTPRAAVSELPRGVRGAATAAARALAGTGIVFGPMTGFLRSSAPLDVPVAAGPQRHYFELKIGAIAAPSPSQAPRLSQPASRPKRAESADAPGVEEIKSASSSPASLPLPSAPPLPPSSSATSTQTASSAASAPLAANAPLPTNAATQTALSPRLQPQPHAHRPAASLRSADETIVRVHTTDGRILEVRSEVPVENSRKAGDDWRGDRAVQKDGYILPPIVDSVSELRRRSLVFPAIGACVEEGSAPGQPRRRGQLASLASHRCRPLLPAVVAVESPVIASSEEQLLSPRGRESAALQPQGRRVTVTISAPDSTGAKPTKACPGQGKCEGAAEAGVDSEGKGHQGAAGAAGSAAASGTPLDASSLVELEAATGGDDNMAPEDAASVLTERADRAIEGDSQRRKRRGVGDANAGAVSRANLRLRDPPIVDALYALPEMPTHLTMHTANTHPAGAQPPRQADRLQYERSQRRQQLQRFRVLREGSAIEPRADEWSSSVRRDLAPAPSGSEGDYSAAAVPVAGGSFGRSRLRGSGIVGVARGAEADAT